MGEGSGESEGSDMDMDDTPEPPTLLQDTPQRLDGALSTEYRHQYEYYVTSSSRRLANRPSQTQDD